MRKTNSRCHGGGTCLKSRTGKMEAERQRIQDQSGLHENNPVQLSKKREKEKKRFTKYH